MSVSLLLSPHGRMRRAQRLIQKSDLQAALKYGTREVSINQRGELCYKYRFADIVYITDATFTKEITSWACTRMAASARFPRNSSSNTSNRNKRCVFGHRLKNTAVCHTKRCLDCRFFDEEKHRLAYIRASSLLALHDGR